MVILSAGVLALQGDFAAHLRALEREGISAVEVRYASQLDSIDAFVVPGGESTTLLKMIRDAGLWEPIRRYHERGGALLGTCAGAILAARTVRNPPQASFGFIDIEIERNAYGRQKESFEASETAPGVPGDPLPMVFIRAPRIRAVGEGVDVLARFRGEPVLVRQGKVIAATFHPELTGDGRVHRLLAGTAALSARSAS